ncbi:MAG: SRPBCC family protein [Bacteroidales bacterium]
MTSVEHSITINRPVEEVFAYASDWKKWHEWFEGVSSFKPVTKTRKGNGARYAYKAKIMGLAIPVEIEIHDFIPDKGWKGRSTRGTPHRTRWEFESAGLGTRFTYGLEFRLPVPVVGPLMDRLFLKPQWEKLLRNSLQNLNLKLTCIES